MSWHTSVIVGSCDPWQVETAKGSVYHLHGEMQMEKSLQAGVVASATCKAQGVSVQGFPRSCATNSRMAFRLIGRRCWIANQTGRCRAAPVWVPWLCVHCCRV